MTKYIYIIKSKEKEKRENEFIDSLKFEFQEKVKKPE